MSVRVRYAPSPTGLQHIGGVRTALFNYFFAKANGGSFILRVEDTDRARYSDEALQDLYDTFKWLGVQWDEGPDVGGDFGPYVQSERQDIYQKYTQQLIDEGFAYYCYCSSERLDAVRAEQKKNKSKQLGYDKRCRDLTADEAEKLRVEMESEGRKPVIRFKIPLRGKTEFNDILLGRVKRDHVDISPDPVIMKADGFPTYHLANVIDDHMMEITHILRAQEWIPSGPLHILLYQAFGWEPPQYCHLPMVMGKDGQKLSKRHGSTSLKDFILAGYLPEALMNYVTMVGWAYDDSREFFTKEEFETLFSVEKINKAPGIFDYKKLDWFNGQYIRKLTAEQLTQRLLPFLQKENMIDNPPTSSQMELMGQLIPLVHERLRKLGDLPEMVKFLFQPVQLEDASLLIPKKKEKDDTLAIFPLLFDFLNDFFGQSDEEAEAVVRDFAEKNNVKLGDILMPLRIAVTCSRVSPPIFGVMRILGMDRVKSRLEEAQALLKAL